jgi:proline iminopeptidase
MTRATLARTAAAGTAMLAAVVAGFGTTVAAALASTRPAVYLSAGFLVLVVVAAAGLWLVLRRLPVRRRVRLIAVLVGALLAVAAIGVLTPLDDPHRQPAAVSGLSFWPLSTGSRLAYVRLPGAQPTRPDPIVILHGGPGLPDMNGDAAFFGQLTALGFDVYVYDQLGAGRSTRLADPTRYGVERDVADLEQIRQAIGASRMVLIGHSYGGALAAAYLAAHPSRVASMVLSSPGPLDPTDSSGDRATAGLAAGAMLRTYAAALAPRALLGYALLQASPAAAHAYLDDLEADSRNDAILTLSESALHCSTAQAHGPVRGSGFYRLQYPQSVSAPPPSDLRPALAGLPTPTLIIKGSCDYLSWSSATDYRRALPNSSLLYLTGAGHNTYQDRPTEVLAAVRGFLTDRPTPAQHYTGDAAPTGYAGPP